MKNWKITKFYELKNNFKIRKNSWFSTIFEIRKIRILAILTRLRVHLAMKIPATLIMMNNGVLPSYTSGLEVNRNFLNKTINELNSR